MSRPAATAAWPAILACCPALLLLGAGMALLNAPLPEPMATRLAALPEDSTIPPGEVLPLSQTMVVMARPIAGYAQLRGQLQPADMVVGRAPLAGQVARVYVKTGQHVNVSDPILELSSGAESRAPVGAERAQDAAEAAQVAAANKQAQLQHQMRSAQVQLAEAEIRVRAARRRVERAQSIISRLKNGEEVTLDMVPAEAPREAPQPETSNNESSKQATPAKRRNAANDKAAEERRAALQNAQKAQDAATQARDRARAAFKAASRAEGDIQTAKQKLQTAQDNATAVQKKFDAGEAKGSDVQIARSALDDAQTDVDEATTRATKARQEADRLDAQAKTAEAEAQKASTRAAQALQKLQLFADSAEPATPTPAPRKPARTATENAPTGSGNRVSIAAAVKMAKDAMAESDAAVRNAERLKKAVKQYEQKTHSTTERLADTAQNLAAAQNKVLDNTIQANLQSVRAPASGQVISVASVAQNVGVGEPLITIGQSGRLEVKFTDQSGAWKFLKAKAVLPAMVRLNGTVTGATTGAATPGATKSGAAMPQPVMPRAASPGSAAANRAPGGPTANEVPVMVRLDDIEAPATPDAPAHLQGVVFDPNQAARSGSRRPRFRVGMEVVCSVARPGTTPALSIPKIALMPSPLTADNSTNASIPPVAPGTTAETIPPGTVPPGAVPPGTVPQGAAPNAGMPSNAPTFLIAVLVPVASTTNSAPGAEAPGATAPSGTSVAPEGDANLYRIEWRPVRLGRGDDMQQEILDGLQAGERIALQPALLYEWTQQHGSKMTVKLENA